MALARERNIPRHRWHQKRFHVKLTKDDYSREWFYGSAIEKINDHIADNGYLDVNGLRPVAAYVADWGVWIDGYREHEVNGLRPVLLADFTTPNYASAC